MRTESRPRPPRRAETLAAALLCAALAASLPSAAEAQSGGARRGAAPGETSAPPREARPAAEPRIDIEIESMVTYTIADGVFIERGPESPLRTGMVGWLEHGGARIARIEVGQVSTRSAFLRVVPERGLLLPRPGERVRLLLEALPEPPPAPPAPSPTVKEPETAAPAFEPLLGPYIVDSETRNLFRGRLGIRQYFQATSNELEDYSRSHLDTAGAIERLEGTPWALEWSAEAIYRDGEALEDSEHYEEVWPEVYQLSLARRYDGKSIARIGRFLPGELPSIGTIDGAQGELVLGPFLRTGGVIGFRPRREDLGLSGKEPTVVPYATFYWEVDRERTYSATTGFLMSMYEGDTDRLAILLDQQANAGRWSFYSSAELDLDSGSAVATDGARLTRFDLTGRYQAGSTVLRGTVNQFSIPDTAAERDALDLITVDAEDFLDDRSRRASLGATHRLTRSLSLDEDVTYIDSDDQADRFLWSVGLTQRDWFARGSSFTLRAYNLGGEDQEGYGGTLSGILPLLRSRLSLLPSVSARVARFGDPDVDLEISDASLRLDWRLGAQWSIQGGVVYTDADDINRFGFDLGATLRW